MRLSVKLRLWVPIAIFAAAGALAYWWHVRAAPAPNVSAEKPVPVRSGVATVRTVPEVYSASGFVTPLNVVDIRSQIMTTVRRVDIKEGQTVRTGQRIFTLDDRSDAANADKAAAQVVKDRALL